ncbi:unannotated protein [freshwater metagenome]|uniref:Unannotated protein n=1 Tax=freshwater metagenome TaxID=449393 RepID=A0A6J6RNU0_9ZZZZ
MTLDCNFALRVQFTVAAVGPGASTTSYPPSSFGVIVLTLLMRQFAKVPEPLTETTLIVIDVPEYAVIVPHRSKPFGSEPPYGPERAAT